MPKSAKKHPATSSTAPVDSAKPSQQPTDEAKTPKDKPAESRSKQSRVIAMLQSPGGTTIAKMMKATGWQQHSVRGFLAGVVRKRLKLKLESKKVDDTRVYRIASVRSDKSASRQSKARSR